MRDDKLLESTINMLLQENNNSNNVIGYRSISENELISLLQHQVIEGRFDNSSEKQTTGSAANVVAFFTNPIKWEDKAHKFFIQCTFNRDRIIETGVGKYYASDTLSKTGIWTGRTGTYSYSLDEFYVSSYSLNDVTGWVNTDRYNIESILKNWSTHGGIYAELYDTFKQMNLPQYNLSDIKGDIPYTQDDDTPMYIWRIWYDSTNKPRGVTKERWNVKTVRKSIENGEKVFKNKKDADQQYVAELSEWEKEHLDEN